MGASVELRSLSHQYADGTTALQDVSLQIGAGECVALLGANGAGKSTLLQHLNGLLRASSGEVWVDGQRVQDKTVPAVRQQVGYVFQHAQDQLFMPTVAEDVAFGPHNQSLPPAQVQQRVQTALAQVGATALAGRAPWRLSAGQQRVVALAGVLAMQPDVLLLDEPSADLDPAARQHLIDLLRGLPQTRIVATHDLDLVHQLCPRVLLLHEGRLLADGARADVFCRSELLQRCHLKPSAAP